MELVIGGRAQGKLGYVLTKYPKASVMEGETPWQGEGLLAPQGPVFVVVIWNHFHLSVRAWLVEGREAAKLWDYVEAWVLSHPNAVIISDEIGCGIVPIDGGERHWREETGRLLCKIAANATQVERVICGIPMRIK